MGQRGPARAAGVPGSVPTWEDGALPSHRVPDSLALCRPPLPYRGHRWLPAWTASSRPHGPASAQPCREGGGLRPHCGDRVAPTAGFPRPPLSGVQPPARQAPCSPDGPPPPAGAGSDGRRGSVRAGPRGAGRRRERGSGRRTSVRTDAGARAPPRTPAHPGHHAVPGAGRGREKRLRSHFQRRRGAYARPLGIGGRTASRPRVCFGSAG